MLFTGLGGIDEGIKVTVIDPECSFVRVIVKRISKILHICIRRKEILEERCPRSQARFYSGSHAIEHLVNQALIKIVADVFKGCQLTRAGVITTSCLKPVQEFGQLP